MDYQRPSAIDHTAVYFTCPSPAEIERMIARGRALRAEAMADLVKGAADALRRAFGPVSATASDTTANLHPHAR